MSRLTDLIYQTKKKDPQLGADLEREVKALSSRLPFGLNFERHSPEAVELPLRPIRKGDKVRVLPPRGETKKGDQRLWQVKAIQKTTRIADLVLLDSEEPKMQSVSLDDLVVVAEFRDLIHPGLVSTGKVTRGGDKPFHTVINGENYHVLKALTYTHRGKVDAIYIDPPYNTGARDWKYNNDYVEGDDLYRHSKWLAFMERRLRIAKDLLNPSDSVLIVTIDEKEYLRLGLLLEQVFPEGSVQMVTSIINATGAIRVNEFTRMNEFVYFVLLGNARITPEATTEAGSPVPWNLLQRREMPSRRGGPQPGPDQFYPIYVELATERIKKIGDPIPLGVSRSTAPEIDGCVSVFPLKPDGTEMNWGLTPSSLGELLKEGFVKLVRNKRKGSQGFSIYYLTSGKVRSIREGAAKVIGKNPDGSVQAVYLDGQATMPTTVWMRESHNAQSNGTKLISKFIPERKFPFPKSLYAVEDALRLFVSGKPDAIILDFFSGSGTTAHAVMRLNQQYGGRRQCISVTNNEVSAEEQNALREQGLRPGDVEWEAWGICNYITKPRVHAAITGKTPDGKPVEGVYQFGRMVKKEKARSFTQIGFVNPEWLDSSAKKKQVVALIGLPQKLVIDECRFIVPDDKRHTASVLFDPKAVDHWLEALDQQEHITNVFIVTPIKRTFDEIKAQVSELLGPVIVSEQEKSPMADGFEENAEFFTLTYEAEKSVGHNIAYSRIAPLLWLRAGALGRCIDKLPAEGWAVADAYGLLAEVDKATPFIKALTKAGDARLAFIVTDDDRRFQSVAKRLPKGVEPVRLYESYLTNFSFSNGD